MKKLSKIFVLLCVAMLAITAVGCSEGGPMKTQGQGVAYGLGNDGCVAEVTVIVDGYGNPVKVQFDEIFPVSDVVKNSSLGTADTFSALPLTTWGSQEPVSYYTYLRIGDKYFKGEANSSNKPVYSEISSEDNKITDLFAYCKTEAGIEWYYNNFLSQNLEICKTDESGTQVGEVKLKDQYNFNTSYGSMRKRYSKYWSCNAYGGIGQFSGLGFNGNMEALENYLLAYGFDAIKLNSDGTGIADGIIALPESEGNSTYYNVIDGVSTGATLKPNTGIYLTIARKAYDKAIASQKELN